MNKKNIFSSIIILIMFGIVIFLLLTGQNQRTKSYWTADIQREYANKLKAEGLDNSAIEAYTQYIKNANPEPDIQANIYYTITKLAENLGKYETALAFLYKAEIIYPETPLRAEIGEHIVKCLEYLGRGLDAQNKLDARTALEPAKSAQGKVLAKIGNEVITEKTLNKELQKLPEWMQKQYTNSEKKREFLEQYLVTELLSRKAKRLGYYKDPEIRQKISDIKKELIVQKLINEELKEKTQVTEDQAELYYKANKSKYKEPAKALIAYQKTASQEEAQSILDNPNKQKFTEIDSWISKDQTFIPQIGESDNLSKRIINTNPGEIIGPVNIENDYFVIKVIEKQPERQPAFEQVKEKVYYDYKQEKQEIAFQELIEDTLKSENVEIYE